MTSIPVVELGGDPPAPKEPKYTLVSSVLQAAREQLKDECNWVKGCLIDTKGAVCADGAIYIACGAQPFLRKHWMPEGKTAAQLGMAEHYYDMTPLTKAGVALRQQALNELGLVVDEAMASEYLAEDGKVYADVTHEWNDSAIRTHADVLAGFDSAIERAKRQERKVARNRRSELVNA